MILARGNMSEEYLVHHGILGMKWGIRRYQNEDGTLTPEGKKRLQKAEKIKSNTNIAVGATNVVTGQLARTFSPKITKNFTDEEKDAYNKATNDKIKRGMEVISGAENKQIIASYREEASGMSDAELKYKITRMKQEKEYVKLKSENIEAGRVSVNDILTVTGNALAIGAVAVPVIMKIAKAVKASKSTPLLGAGA